MNVELYLLAIGKVSTNSVSLSSVEVAQTSVKFNRDGDFQGKQLCRNCVMSLLESVYSKRKEFAPLRW